MKKISMALTMASCLAISNVMADDDYTKYQTYHVTITNTTGHHVITPPVIIAHKKGFHLFKITEKSSPGLAMLAETGDSSTLVAELESNDKVTAIAASPDDFIPYGTSKTFEITAPKKSYFTVAGMLATTNDGFTAVTIKGPKKHRYAHGMGMTYDAGSEENDELCAHIPGPPCAMDSGNGGVPTPEGENFVTIHNGIHGGGDLTASDLDWRGPTSMVRIHNDG